MKNRVAAAALWVVNLALYCALLDVAVEAVLHGTGMRAFAIATVVVYTALVGIFFRKFDLAVQTELAAIALCAEVAYSGLTLGTLGAFGGMTILGVTAGVFAVGLSLALLLATIAVVLFAPRLPAALRVVVALALAYACVPLGIVLAHGGNLAEALASNAPLPPGPFWMRGAFLAAAVYFPIAALAMLLAAIVAVARKHLAAGTRFLAGAAVLAFATQIGGLEARVAGLPAILAYAGATVAAPSLAQPIAAATSGAQNVAPAASPAVAAPLQAGAATSESSAGGASPVATASSDAIVASAGGTGAVLSGVFGGAAAQIDSSDGPKQHVDAFVRALVAAEKYVRHQDFDPAALANTLPADPHALFQYVRDSIALDDYAGAMRGAKGTLMSHAGNADDKALLLAELLRDRAIPYRFATSTLSADDAAALVAAAAVPPAPPADAVPDALYADVGVTKDQVQQESAKRATAEAAYVANGLAYAKERAPALWSAVSNSAPAAAAPASAVQAGATHVFVQANVGGTWTDLDPSLARLDAGQHLGGSAVATYATLAPERFRTARFRMVTTYGSADTSALDHTVRVADVNGTPISIGNDPDVPKIENAASATAFQAYIGVGHDQTKGVKFGLKDAQGAALTAVRLHVDVAGGGVPAVSYTRTLWTTGAATEAPLALSRSYELLLVPGSPGPSFTAAMTLETVIAMKPLLLFNATPAKDRTLPAASDLALAYPVELLNYVQRDERIASAIGASSSPPVRFMYDRTNIVMLSNSFVRAGKDLRTAASFDIVENGQRVTSSDPSAARLANVERGIADTSIEQQVLRFIHGAGLGTPQLFATAKSASVATTLVASAGAMPSRVPVVSGDAMRETLAHGEVALALTAPVSFAGESHYAWWAVDPKTGDTVGRMDDGAGQDLPEESVLLFYIKRVSMAFTILGCIIAGPSCGEDVEIGIITGGMSAGNGAAGVINEVISIFKSIYEAGGGSYGQGGSSGGGGGAGGGNGGSGSGGGSNGSGGGSGSSGSGGGSGSSSAGGSGGGGSGSGGDSGSSGSGGGSGGSGGGDSGSSDGGAPAGGTNWGP